MSASPAHVVLVHGLWHGAWSWDVVRERLDAAGVPSTAVDLPMQSLAGDAEIVTACLDGIDGDVLLVGHSYGGAVITQAGGHRSVTSLVYLAAFQLDAGESIGRVLPERGIPATGLGAALAVDGDEVRLDPARGREILYNTSPPALADAALARLTPVSRGLFRAVPTEFAWRSRPSTYVVCTQDRCVHPDLQRAIAERADRVLEWPCDHSPTASRPDDVAALLAESARRAA